MERTYLEGTHQRFVDRHHSSGVVELATVVGRTEECHQLAFGKELVAIFDHLVRATDEIQVVPMQEFGHYVGAKREGNAAIVLAPALHILVGVRPEKITEETGVRNVGGTHDAPNLLHRVKIGRET